MRTTLMIPGPVEIPADIFAEYTRETVAHYGADWAAFYLKTVEGVSRFMKTGGPSFLLPGSGSLGVETAAASFCRGKRCLVLNNGFFGDRLAQIAGNYTETLKQVRSGLGAPLDLDEVRRSLKAERYDAVVCTHVETSTGMLNPVRQIAEIVRESGALFIVDAVSSAGIEELDMDAWGVDVAVMASQKGFECPPGLAMVSCGKRAAGLLEKGAPGSWYTDLRIWLHFYHDWHDWHPFPVTLPTNSVKALARSLAVIEQEGRENRLEGQRRTAAAFRKALRRLGLSLYVPDERCAHGLTAVAAEGKFEPSELVGYLKQGYHMQIAGSLGELKSLIFRIGHMSRAQRDSRNLTSVIAGIGLFLKSRKLACDLEGALQEIVDA